MVVLVKEILPFFSIFNTRYEYSFMGNNSGSTHKIIKFKKTYFVAKTSFLAY